MKKFEIINNSLVVTDTDNNNVVFDNPKSDIYYSLSLLGLTPNKVSIIDLSDRYNQTNLYECLLSEAVDSSLVPFTTQTFTNFARQNLGFKTASGGSGAIVYLSENYNALNLEETAYLKNGDLAYVYNSQGTSWLPGTLGGTYYPSGFYFWNGTNWISDRNAIATQFDTNMKILDETAIASVSNAGRFRYYVNSGFSYLECCIQTGTTSYEWILISQQEIL